MKASSLPVHQLALLLSTQPDRLTLFIIMRFSVIALAALLGTTYALPLVAEASEDAALSISLTLRSAEPEAIAEADPKKHKRDDKAGKHDHKGGKHDDKGAKPEKGDPKEKHKEHHKETHKEHHKEDHKEGKGKVNNS
ncbi:hypothetical protein P171DRAFT_479720 [Karstenula rhodostoma CBS 690.94]|uniref:Uncharacterized protein n=1 Tax=Karstenula rhodostoma CBS 690.94 TaxID=1392251 RepID=A0A9P4PSP7_9PLEO|nr:hypothetical protein P171DRAFT_479720 [Karstenula rhodostoma CBS 690.94]